MTISSTTAEKTSQALETLALVPIEKASEITGLSHWTLRYYVRLGRLQPVRFGRRLFFERSELARMIEEARKKARVQAKEVAT